MHVRNVGRMQEKSVQHEAQCLSDALKVNLISSFTETFCYNISEYF